MLFDSGIGCGSLMLAFEVDFFRINIRSVSHASD